MSKIEDIKKRGGVIVIIGSKKEVMAKIKEIAMEEANEKYRAKVERATTVRGIWDAMDDEEKVYVLAKAGYEF